jgi:hypothetical protein
VKRFILIIFLVLAHEYSFSSDKLKSTVNLQQHTEQSIKLVGQPLHISCNEAVQPEIDNQTYPVQHELYKDGQGEEINVSGISMEYANQLYQELATSNEIQFNFPEVGCEARAHKMTKILEEKGVIAAKVFIQGSKDDETALQYKTDLSPTGHINWEFHVAPILKVKTGKKIKIEVKDGWFSNKEIEVDQYIDMVFDPSTASGPIPLKLWRNNLLQHKKDKSIHTFYTRRFNYRPNEKYNTPTKYDENDNFRMMSGLDLGIECFKNRAKGIKDNRCEFK